MFRQWGTCLHIYEQNTMYLRPTMYICICSHAYVDKLCGSDHDRVCRRLFSASQVALIKFEPSARDHIAGERSCIWAAWICGGTTASLRMTCIRAEQYVDDWLKSPHRTDGEEE